MMYRFVSCFVLFRYCNCTATALQRQHPLSVRIHCTSTTRGITSRLRTYSTVLSWVGVPETHRQSGIYFVFDSRGEILIIDVVFDYLRRYQYRNECLYRRISRFVECVFCGSHTVPRWIVSWWQSAMVDINIAATNVVIQLRNRKLTVDGRWSALKRRRLPKGIQNNPHITSHSRFGF